MHCILSKIIGLFSIYIGLFTYVSTQPLYHKWNMTQGQFLSKVQLVWTQFFFSKTSSSKQGEKIQFGQQLTHNWRKKWWIHALRAWSETQTAIFRIWNRVADIISNKNYIYIYIYIYIHTHIHTYTHKYIHKGYSINKMNFARVGNRKHCS